MHDREKSAFMHVSVISSEEQAYQGVLVYRENVHIFQSVY